MNQSNNELGLLLLPTILSQQSHTRSSNGPYNAINGYKQNPDEFKNNRKVTTGVKFQQLQSSSLNNTNTVLVTCNMTSMEIWKQDCAFSNTILFNSIWSYSYGLQTTINPRENWRHAYSHRLARIWNEPASVHHGPLRLNCLVLLLTWNFLALACIRAVPLFFTEAPLP